MMNQLKWQLPKYWEVRNELLDKGLIVTGTGKRRKHPQGHGPFLREWKFL